MLVVVVHRLEEGMLMSKATKELRKQADTAERSALKETDGDASMQLLNLADAFRAQAEVIKAKQKKLKRKKK
jgi:hypothetical protein